MKPPLTLRFEDVSVGDPITPIEFHFSLTSLVKYAAATWDFHPYHYDTEFVRRFGMPAPVADGQMLGALMARMMMSWGGDDAFLRRLGYRQRRPVFAGETVVFEGQVVSRSAQAGGCLVDAALTARKTDGAIVISDAVATIELASAAPSQQDMRGLP